PAPESSRYTDTTSPPVPGLQLDGYWPDACNAYLKEPDLFNKANPPQPWIPGCTPPDTPGQTCSSDCPQHGEFVIRIPDDCDGHLVTAGTPANRVAFASDFIFSDFVLEKGWAYVSQDKGNAGLNFYRDGTDEIGSCGTPWCPAAAIQE